MSCTVEDRERVRAAAQAIQDTVPTVMVEVNKPAVSQYDAWTLDAVLETQADGIPPAVLRELALADLTLRPTPSQAEYAHVAATA